MFSFLTIFFLAGSMAQNTYTACAPIYLHSLKCQGNENGWRECVLNTDTSEDSHANDVAVMCSNRGKHVCVTAIASRHSYQICSTTVQQCCYFSFNYNTYCSKTDNQHNKLYCGCGHHWRCSCAYHHCVDNCCACCEVGNTFWEKTNINSFFFLHRARRNRVEIPVDKQNIVVSASFPKDSASPVDVLNQAYDDTANEDDIDLGEEKGVLDEVEKK